MGNEAIILRHLPAGEHDVLVDMLSTNHGLVKARARSARRSQRRFGGALELGAIVRPSFSPRRNRAGMQLDECLLVHSPKQARLDLCRFYQLAYVLELALKTSMVGQPDQQVYAAVRQYVSSLERFRPCHEQLVAWELALLGYMGQAVQWWPCVVTGAQPEGVSLDAGGAVASTVRPRDYRPVSPSILRKFAEITRGDQPLFDNDEHVNARQLINHIWQTILERPVKSAACIGPDAFSGPELAPRSSVDGPGTRSGRE
ncbi:MAG: DNA repair protein RecO [Myxococcota bacterium]|nr:DNA repair protein RecO [Myxococcota bacterium]